MKKKARAKDAPRLPTAIDAYIGVRMRKRRNALKMSQSQVAEALDITRQQVQKYEDGHNRVSAARLFEICTILKASVSSMFPRPKA